jgi:coatomer protein complex subunit alpha (xenin)
LSDPLAYYTAKTNGLDDLALDILEEAGMTEDDLPPPPQNSGHQSLAPPTAQFNQAESVWPTKNLGESFFDRALANGGAEGVSGESSGSGGIGAIGNGNGNGEKETLDAWAADEEGEEDEEEEGWDLDAEVIQEEEVVPDEVEEEASADLSEGVSKGPGEDEMWVRNSPLAADHAAAGAFESAMQVSRLAVSSCSGGFGVTCFGLEWGKQRARSGSFDSPPSGHDHALTLC